MKKNKLSTIAQRLADEIKAQDWSDAHSRADGARHDRSVDRKGSETLTEAQAETVRLNVIWVTGQALAEDDPNFDIRAFAEAADVAEHWLVTTSGRPSGVIKAGLRPTRHDED